MKIAHVMNRFPSISETFILSQITGLIDRGHSVEIYARTADQTVVHGDVLRYRLDECTHYVQRESDTMPEALPDRLRAAWRIGRAHSGRRQAALIGSLDPFRCGREAMSLRALFRVARFAEGGLAEADIVHCHFGPSGIEGALLKAAGLMRAPLITTFYGYDVTSFVKQQGIAVYRRLFEHCDAVLAISQLMVRQLKALGCPANKLVLQPVSVKIRDGEAAPSVRLASANGHRRLLTVARLVEKKGAEYAIRAVAALLARYPEIEYNIVGDGPLRAQLEGLIRELEAEQKIRILGYMPQAEMANYMAQADVLVVPSITAADGDQEGTPTVVIEALGRGLPIVATRHSAIPELVEDGITGYLVPERDVMAMSGRIEFLIQHPAAWPRLAEAGRAKYAAHFDPDLLNDRLEALYKRLLARYM